jgi:hypothetical protein
MWAHVLLFESVFALALWSHIRMYASDPGFIPRGYNYNITLMTPTNVSLFNYITLTRSRNEAILEAQKKLSKSAIT